MLEQTYCAHRSHTEGASAEESGVLDVIKALKMSPVPGFPGGAVVEGPPADAGDTGSCPGPGISHMPRSGWAREPWPLSLHIQSLCSATGEATTVRGSRTAKKKKARCETPCMT